MAVGEGALKKTPAPGPSVAWACCVRGCRRRKGWCCAWAAYVIEAAVGWESGVLGRWDGVLLFRRSAP
jgi:hypothetical protein